MTVHRDSIGFIRTCAVFSVAIVVSMVTEN